MQSSPLLLRDLRCPVGNGHNSPTFYSSRRPFSAPPSQPSSQQPSSQQPAPWRRLQLPCRKLDQLPAPAFTGFCAFDTASFATAFTIHSKFSSPTDMPVRIRRRVHEVDRIRHAILHRKLHRVQVIPQRAAQRQRILLHALQQALGSIHLRVQHIPLMRAVAAGRTP